MVIKPSGLRTSLPLKSNFWSYAAEKGSGNRSLYVVGNEVSRLVFVVQGI